MKTFDIVRSKMGRIDWGIMIVRLCSALLCAARSLAGSSGPGISHKDHALRSGTCSLSRALMSQSKVAGLLAKMLVGIDDRNLRRRSIEERDE